MATVKFLGEDVQLKGNFPQIGDTVADFQLTQSDLKEFSLKEHKGKRKILSIFPSLDTGLCAASIIKFNQEAAKLENTIILCISADLPFAHSRFCTTNHIATNNVMGLSTFRNPSFSENLGVLVTTGPIRGLTARSVIVLDENDKVIFSQLTPETSQEIDFEGVFDALK